MEKHVVQAATSSDDSAIGRSVDRIDGALKVRGLAIYSYEHVPTQKPAYGFILGAAVARGILAEINTQAAETAPGVIMVMTHRNAPPQAEFGGPTTPEVAQVFTRARPVLSGSAVRYHDEPVALVVAETFEEARAAAGMILCRYEAAPGSFSLHAAVRDTYRPERANAGIATDSVIGDLDAAMTSAPVTVDASYETAFASHNPLEPHAAVAEWVGDRLTLYTGTQSAANIRIGLAATLQVPIENVRVVSPFIGGGFGAKLIVHPETVLAALAARQLRRPVKVALSRQQMFGNAGHRPAMTQRVRLAADRDGKLSGFGHDVIATTSRFDEFAEQTAGAGRSLYAAPNRHSTHRLARLDTNRGEWMRAPGEAPGLAAIECAMDELAEKLALDPIELRIRNEPERDPERDVPFSTRNLIGCMQEGAQRFGWDRRPRQPGSRREGRKFIGYGMAAGIRANYLGPTEVRVSLDARGIVTIQTDMTDIGTGTYTILAQVAADHLGLPLSSIRVELGDTALPRSAGSGGSWGATSTCTALLNACNSLRETLATVAATHERSPLRGVALGGARFEQGSIVVGDRRQPIASLIAAIAPGGLSAEGRAERGETYRAFSQHTYGAHFAEVEVDIDTGEPRLRRMLGVFAAGRLFNPKTARSQIIGGMLWGAGAALTEETVLDPRHGHFVNHDLADYHVLAHADAPNVEVVFLDEEDDKANPFGAKGIGELGNCGSSAAVANAVYNATGIRVRSFPITLDKLLPSLPVM
ncbi:xanthine dehydrogenase molybdenum-binding subunit YagR 1 [Rhizobium gallicum]|uniref:Xanthine dehydrogenase molybdenum-binding subunit YagR 1 n=1 Tax=Rhizobium gallicum TaxID=56730 RepID=A0A1L5NLX5_9HYPH|nr:xanthine dehydrogenase family protein molybdopterin-binding subunit [Rhizobium gallicum]APO68911.1 xanthine dehydrogenase molybdenum-binding subunit YagR 1 [Rhizobium gallicum]